MKMYELSALLEGAMMSLDTCDKDSDEEATLEDIGKEDVQELIKALQDLK